MAAVAAAVAVDVGASELREVQVKVTGSGQPSRNNEAIKPRRRVRQLGKQSRVGTHGSDHGAQPMPVLGRQAFFGEVTRGDKASEASEVETVPPLGGIAGDRMGGSLHNKCTDKVRSTNEPIAPVEGHSHRFTSMQGLGTAGCLQGWTTGDSNSPPRTLTYSIWQEHVKNALATDPTMLQALGGDPARREAHFGKRLGDSMKHLRIGPNVDHCVDIIRRSRRELATFGTVQMDQLAADHGPAIVEPPVQIHDSMPRRGLRRRHRGKLRHR